MVRLLLPLLLIGACADPPDPTMADTPTGPAAKTEPTAEAEAERVWQAFAARAEAATVIRVYYYDATRSGLRSVLTVHRDGRAARDHAGMNSCRELLTEGSIRRACGGVLQEESPAIAAEEQSAALVHLFQHFSAMPVQIREQGSLGTEVAFAPVMVRMQPMDTVSVTLGMNHERVVGAVIEGAGLEYVRFDVFKVEFDPPLPPDFFEASGNPRTPDFVSTYEEWAQWHGIHKTRYGTRHSAEEQDVQPRPPLMSPLLNELVERKNGE